MFFQEVSSVLLLDRSGNDMLCSILFLSLGLDVLTDHFYWCPSCRQKAETLAPECFLPKFFPDFLCSFWNQIIDNFSPIFHHHNQVIIHQVHWMCIVIHIFHKTSPFLNNYLILSTNSIIPWITLPNKCSFLFFTIHLPPVEEREFLLYIMLK